ncbi:MAG: L-lactate dehydrogenase [Candidatus Humimicrobiaceae bacterium]
MVDSKPKVSIIGCGNVGIRYAYALLINGLARSIVLVDVDKERAEGEMMDLTHASVYTSPVNIIAGGYSDIGGSDLVVITAGKKQKKGESRLDLVKANIEIYKKIIPSIMENSPDSIILVVSNPVDILSYAAYKLSSKPSSRVFGSGTTLDTARLKSEIAKHCELNSKNVHSYILGEHGDSEVPIWSRAMIGGLLFRDYCPMCRRYDTCNLETDLEGIFEKVKNSAYEIIEKKGETSYGIGLSLARITRSILRDENSILPVSTLVDGYLGIEDVYFSLPVVVNGDGLRETIRLKLSKEEENRLRDSADQLKKVIKDSGLK